MNFSSLPLGRLLIGLLVTLVILVGCGDGDTTEASQAETSETGDSDEAGESTDQTVDPAEPPAEDSEEPQEQPTEEPADNPATDAGQSAGELPGEEWEGFAESGDVLTVVGVGYDDVLNIRSIPGTDGDIVATVDPDGEVVATGLARLLPSSAWYEVSVDSADEAATGWASVAFLAYAGVTDDATAEFLDGGPVPTASSVQELATVVADSFASTDGPVSDVVQVTPSLDGDDSSLAEVTYDVIGLGDDAAVGYRLHVFANNDAGTFSLKSIERTVLCGRGLVGELCA